MPRAAPEHPRTITQAESWNVLGGQFQPGSTFSRVSTISERRLEADIGPNFAFVPLGDLRHHFSRDGLTVAKATIEKFVARAARLYEQDRKEPSGPSQLGMYVRRWVAWSGAGHVIKNLPRTTGRPRRAVALQWIERRSRRLVRCNMPSTLRLWRESAWPAAPVLVSLWATMLEPDQNSSTLRRTGPVERL